MNSRTFGNLMQLYASAARSRAASFQPLLHKLSAAGIRTGAVFPECVTQAEPEGQRRQPAKWKADAAKAETGKAETAKAEAAKAEAAKAEEAKAEETREEAAKAARRDNRWDISSMADAAGKRTPGRFAASSAASPATSPSGSGTGSSQARLTRKELQKAVAMSVVLGPPAGKRGHRRKRTGIQEI